MGNFGIKIFFTPRGIAFIPSFHLYVMKGYRQTNGKKCRNEYVLGFWFLTLNIELWNNKFWDGFFRITNIK